MRIDLQDGPTAKTEDVVADLLLVGEVLLVGHSLVLDDHVVGVIEGLAITVAVEALEHVHDVDRATDLEHLVVVLAPQTHAGHHADAPVVEKQSLALDAGLVAGALARVVVALLQIDPNPDHDVDALVRAKAEHRVEGDGRPRGTDRLARIPVAGVVGELAAELVAGRGQSVAHADRRPELAGLHVREVLGFDLLLADHLNVGRQLLLLLFLPRHSLAGFLGGRVLVVRGGSLGPAFRVGPRGLRVGVGDHGWRLGARVGGRLPTRGVSSRCPAIGRGVAGRGSLGPRSGCGSAGRRIVVGPSLGLSTHAQVECTGSRGRSARRGQAEQSEHATHDGAANEEGGKVEDSSVRARQEGLLRASRRMAGYIQNAA